MTATGNCDRVLWLDDPRWPTVQRALEHEHTRAHDDNTTPDNVSEPKTESNVSTPDAPTDPTDEEQ